MLDNDRAATPHDERALRNAPERVPSSQRSPTLPAPPRVFDQSRSTAVAIAGCH